jgi:hypothetical protein
MVNKQNVEKGNLVLPCLNEMANFIEEVDKRSNVGGKKMHAGIKKKAEPTEKKLPVLSILI